eukprot:3581094-Rhodomonas_salina.1
MGSVPRRELDAYFKRHRINELLRDLAEDLALKRPDNPTRHLHARLTGMLGETDDQVKAAIPEPAPGVCFLRVNVECRTRAGSSVAHFGQNGSVDSASTLGTPPAWRLLSSAWFDVVRC